jgi:phage tail sheath protein FI
VTSNADGDDGAPITDYDLIGSDSDRSGLFALDKSEPFNLLCLPPLSRELDVGPGALLVAMRLCRDRRALLVVDPPVAWLTADDALNGMKSWNLPSENAVMYFPRLLAHDKLRGQCESFAPCGAVAGILARSDESFPVWGPPKIEDAVLRPGYRRTLAAFSAGAPDWQLLAARRLALFILNSVERGTRWVTLARLRPHLPVAKLAAAQVRAFFERLHEAGAFGARAREESFFVVCDERVNSTVPADSCEFHLVIGFAAVRRREFHSFRIVHSTSGSRITPVSLNQLNFAQLSPAEFEWVERIAGQLLV